VRRQQGKEGNTNTKQHQAITKNAGACFFAQEGLSHSQDGQHRNGVVGGAETIGGKQTSVGIAKTIGRGATIARTAAVAAATRHLDNRRKIE
jgi:hypothetical protein